MKATEMKLCIILLVLLAIDMYIQKVFNLSALSDVEEKTTKNLVNVENVDRKVEFRVMVMVFLCCICVNKSIFS